MMSGVRKILAVLTLVLPSAVLQEKPENSTLLNHKPNLEKFQDLRVLSELPLNKLLKVKTAIAEFSEKEMTPVMRNNVKNAGFPEAMALSSNPEDSIRRTDLWSKKGKVGKVNTMFMLSITTLAFLAFGGYLLCLIVQAIKSKGSMGGYSPMTGTQPVMMMSGSVKKKKPQINYGRRRREAMDEPAAEEMYNVLIILAEGYAAWDHL